MTPPRRLLVLPVIALVAVTIGVAGTGQAASSTRLPSAHHPGHHQSSHRWVMGYYPIYQRSLMPPGGSIDWAAMTHLVIGAVEPRANGSLDTTFDDDAVHGPKLAKQLGHEARAHGVVPLLMVGGAGAHQGFAAAATHHRAALVKHLLATMRSYHFAGLDLDWEPVRSGEGATVAKLAAALRKKAPHAILTMPVLWVSTTFPTVPPFYGTLAHSLDRIDVMTYGMAGAYDGWRTWHSSALRGATPSTPSDIAINVKSFEAAGVPARKLGIGIGFYGMCWNGGVTGPRQPVGSAQVVADDNVMSYSRIMSSYYSPSAYHYDTKAQAPYLGFAQPTGPQGCTYVSYENPRSVAAKGAYAEKQGLGAEIVWTINQAHLKGRPASKSDPLLAAVHRSFH